jgi:hypothetical protein
VVSSSRSTFPRHWAWGHGAGTLCGAGLDGAGNAVAAAPRQRDAQRHGIGAQRGQANSRAEISPQLASTVSPGLAAAAARGQEPFAHCCRVSLEVRHKEIEGTEALDDSGRLQAMAVPWAAT